MDMETYNWDEVKKDQMNPLLARQAIHRVLHAGGEPAVTIHAYSPPLRRTGAYRVGPRGDLQREAQPFEVELRADAALV